MTREEAIEMLKKDKTQRENALKVLKNYDLNFSKVNGNLFIPEELAKAFECAIGALEQEPCEMTAEEYRQRMMKAFFNSDCGELIAVCVLPTEKEFEHLEWLLKNHYKKESCDDVISRQELLNRLDDFNKWCKDGRLQGSLFAVDVIKDMPPVTPTQKWTLVSERLPEEDGEYLVTVASVEDGFYLRLYDYYAATHKFDTEEYEYDGDVLAWMPLPKPYKAESEEK